jgi:hypothetical protein
MSRVISTDPEVTKNVSEASVHNASWHCHLDRPINVTAPGKTTLLDPDLAKDVIYVFSERQTPLLWDESSAASSLTASTYSCTEKLWRPLTGAPDVSLTTTTSSEWSDMDFGTCSECNDDSSDWLATIDFEHLEDSADNWNV